MTYLVDANVLSEATKPAPDAQAIAWLRQNERDLVVDPVIVGEIRFGILLTPAGRRRKRLEAWFDEGVRRIACLTWDVAVGLRWAKLLADHVARAAQCRSRTASWRRQHWHTTLWSSLGTGEISKTPA